MSVFKKMQAEYNGEIQTFWQTNAKLIAVGSENEKLVNTNGNKFIINQVEMPNASGVIKPMSAMCYEGNYNPAKRKDGSEHKLKEGVSYLTTIRQGEDAEGKPAVYIQMSHLTSADRPTVDDFAAMFASSGDTFIPNSVREVKDDGSTEELDKAAKAGAPVESGE